MTQQYLAGELSLRLALLQDLATEQGFKRDAARLRKAAETGPLTSLSAVLARALALSDSLCWDSLDRGASAAFISEATIAGELYEFGVCARLIDDGWGGLTVPTTRSLCCADDVHPLIPARSASENLRLGLIGSSAAVN